MFGVQYRELDVSNDAEGSQYARRLCYVLLERCVDVITQWAASVPGFGDLCAHDRQLLFRSALLEVFTLRIADRSLP